MPQLLVQNPSNTTPKPLAAAARNFRHATIIACQSLAGPSVGPNTGMVKLGLSANASEQPLEFNPGDERNLTAAAGQMLDLSQYYLSVANANDGVVILFQ
jgi:hypothetical protein